MMTSLQSHLLIASGDLAEPFNRAVVLVVRHNADGALGLILNRRTGAELKATWDKLSDVPCHREAAIFLGGPCEGPLVALHTHEFLLEMEVMPGLYFCAGKDKLETLASQNDEESQGVKFFAGYSGWAAGQLENEIARGSWSVMPANVEHVFGPEDELWVRASRFVADAAWRDRLGIKEAPPDLRAN
jgi:putative transcriptional regulator